MVDPKRVPGEDRFPIAALIRQEPVLSSIVLVNFNLELMWILCNWWDS